MGFLTWNPWMPLTICKQLILYPEVRAWVISRKRVDLILRGSVHSEILSHCLLVFDVHYLAIKNLNNRDTINNLED